MEVLPAERALLLRRGRDLLQALDRPADPRSLAPRPGRRRRRPGAVPLPGVPQARVGPERARHPPRRRRRGARQPPREARRGAPALPSPGGRPGGARVRDLRHRRRPVRPPPRRADRDRGGQHPRALPDQQQEQPPHPLHGRLGAVRRRRAPAPRRLPRRDGPLRHHPRQRPHRFPRGAARGTLPRHRDQPVPADADQPPGRALHRRRALALHPRRDDGARALDQADRAGRARTRDLHPHDVLRQPLADRARRASSRAPASACPVAPPGPRAAGAPTLEPDRPRRGRVPGSPS